MNKKIVIVLVVIAVVLVGAFIYKGNQGTDEIKINSENNFVNTSSEPVGEQTDGQTGAEKKIVDVGVSVNESGTYEPYADSKISKAVTGDVVLFFRASWCPTCRSLDKDIKENLSNIPSTLTILDVDYDNSTALKQKYGVTYQHTLVQVDKDGNLIKKWSGSPDLDALVSQVQ
ncbi:MAG: thioredoxin family protein [Patescibacteria group bacterium]